MENLLGVNRVEEPEPVASEEESEEPVYRMEVGLIPIQGMTYPSSSHWKQVEQILEHHIQFASSSSGPQKARLHTRYLVGRMYHLYPNRAQATTDYMMSYEQNPRTGHYEWRRLMATYYHESPIRHDVNLFYPYPLPLQFE